jgi:uncharacterized protein (TIGR02466 family)
MRLTHAPPFANRHSTTAHRMNWLDPPTAANFSAHDRLAMLRLGVARAPENARLLLALGWALLATRDFAASIVAFESAAARGAGLSAHLGRGEALLEAGRPQEALAAFDRAVALAQRAAQPQYGRARALAAATSPPAGLEAALAALADHPDDGPLFVFAARGLLAAGRAGELLAIAGSALRSRPLSSAARHYEALALAALGRRDDAAAIMDAARVRVTDVAPPDRWPNAAAFNAAIRAEVLANKTLVPDPFGGSFNHGTQAQDMLAGNPPATLALVAAIKRKVEAYAATLQGNSDMPERVTMTIWGVLLESDGHQRQHFHPGGWISGVYYVSVPEVCADAGRKRGWLVVPTCGRRDDGDGRDWPVRDVEPRAGRLVLFPSYYAHRTTPTGVAADRVSIAFDVKPA